ncbi:hypothetical protein GCM10008090_06860 [Arenicella chitinivorans]|uniref:DUF3667 domain-containing protein n=1 Tax=Arenicella chitinivorans TaxID=1329800 RepID=A0A918VI35_9GAMM|nr:DUF3667 domain-containing protein [Arenicella chitinivorans]GHA00594.1 hypothetical protein GCM10008090_06860 [Arenicella chitinivorans]
MINCLNCATQYEGNYCPECGQAAATNRITVKRSFQPEFLSGVFNFNRGFLAACISLLYRPGHLAMDYLCGQRKRYFNFIGLLLVLLAVEALIWSLSANSPVTFISHAFESSLRQNPGFTGFDGSKVETVLYNQRLLYLFGVPMAAILPWLLARQLKLNFAEHMVVATFMLALSTLYAILLIDWVGLLPLAFEHYVMLYSFSVLPVLLMNLLMYWQLLGYGSYNPLVRAILACVCAIWVNITVTLFMGLTLWLVIRPTA